MGFQLLFLFIPGIPATLKFALVSGAAILSSYMASQFLIKPYPKSTITLMGLAPVLMMLIL